MKRILALILVLSLLFTGCGRLKPLVTTGTDPAENNTTAPPETTGGSLDVLTPMDHYPEFDSPGDSAFLQYLEDSVYAELSLQLEGDGYQIQGITATYISQEYLEELTYNSQSNIFFGRTLAELDAMFQGTRYVFTLGEDGQTEVRELEVIEDRTTEEILTNVAIGAGVILVCVAVAYFTGGTGVPATVSVIHTIAVGAATGGAIEATMGLTLGGLSAGIVRYIETGDINEALKAAALEGSEQMKWGAITGVITGGLGAGLDEILKFARASGKLPSWMDSEKDIYNFIKKTDDTATNQVSFLDRKKITNYADGSTRPDIVTTNPDGTLNAIEVKNYDLENNLSSMISKLKNEVGDRVNHLPEGSTQELYLDVRGRGYTEAFLENVKQTIQQALGEIYEDIPVHFFK